MRVLSGDHVGSVSAAVLCVICLGFAFVPASRSTIQISKFPVRFDENAIQRPSGDTAGSTSAIPRLFQLILIGFFPGTIDQMSESPDAVDT
jgi:hypothetical protein